MHKFTGKNHVFFPSPLEGGEAEQGRYPVNIDPSERVAREGNPGLRAEQGMRSDEGEDGGRRLEYEVSQRHGRRRQGRMPSLRIQPPP